ncbi:MAG: FG-GAP-like repeat-containing protein [Elusimicrobiota bacterium]
MLSSILLLLWRAFSAVRRARTAWLAAALLALPAVRCAAVLPPSAVTDLAVSAIVSTGLGASSMTVTLTWTAPSDGDSGDISGGTFTIRYSTIASITNDSEFDNAPFSVDIPTDAVAGTLRSFTTSFLDAAASHYFVIKTTDSEGLTSGLSNPATAQAYIIAVPGTGGISNSIAWADFDGDGDLDFAVGNQGSDYVVTNNGDGTFTPSALPGTAGLSRGVAWGDFDNDGDLDLAAAVGSNNDEYIAVNDGGGNFSTFTLTGSGGDSYGVSWGDYDNDGDLDLAVGNYGGQDEVLARNNGDGTFSTFTLTGSGGQSGGVAWGDYDSDGDLDLAVANLGSDYIAENNGDGTFSTFTLTDLGGWSFGIAWGDYDGDGDLDLGAANNGDEYLGENQGGGAFAMSALAGTGGNSRGAAWGDYDNDGDLDLAVGNTSSADYIARNEGGGSFTQITLGGTGSNSGLSWGDYDNDGDLDLGVAKGSGDDELILRNDIAAVHNDPLPPGSGFSASFEEYGIASSSGVLTLRWDDATDVETATAGLNYFVRMGTTAVAGSSTTLKIPARYGLDGYSGGGSFLYSTKISTSQRGLKIAMQKEATVYWAVVTEDGELHRSVESSTQTVSLAAPPAVTDLAVSAIVSTGLGASSMTVTLSWTAPHDAAEFDVRYSTTGPIASAGAYTGASFQAPPSSTTAAAGEPQLLSIDFLDAAVTHYFALTSKDAVGLRSGLSNPATAQAYVAAVPDTGGSSRGFAWGDHDGDGDLDFAVTNNGPDYVGTNNGDGTFSISTVSGSGGDSHGVAWGDYDGDGDLDLAVAAEGNGAEYIAVNQGGGSFSTFTLTGSTGGSRGVAWGDYDNDGDLDLALAKSGSELIARNDGGGVFGTFSLDGTSGESYGVAWGDYDNDGDLDLAVADSGTAGEDEYIAVNNGDGTFSTFTLTGFGGHSRGIAWGDYDGDGDLDLAVANAGSEDEYVARNDGGGAFTQITLTGSGGSSNGIAWTDYDNDGDLDLAVGNYGAGEDDYIARNDGSGTFARITLAGTGGNTQGIAWGDYDGDGDLDLGVAKYGEDVLLVRNDTTTVNSVPAAPASGFSSTFEEYSAVSTSGTLTLLWDDGSDLETSTAALNYLVRVGTNPGGSEVLPVPESCGLDGYSGGGSFLYSTWISTSQRGIRVAAPKQNTVYWAVVSEDGGRNRSPESGQQSVGLFVPGAVTDLQVSTIGTDGYGASTMSVTLTWTAPGDDGYAGAISSGTYDLRYSTYAAMTGGAAYEGASYGVVLGTSVSPGEQQVLTLTGLDYGKTHYFAITTKDGAGLRSELSNPTTAYAYVLAVEGSARDSQGLAWGDYDGDGDLDLVVANPNAAHQDQLFTNEGGGVFTQSVLAGGCTSQSFAWGDYDNDGDLDLAAARTDSDSALLRNDGGTFIEVDPNPLGGSGGDTWGVAWGDYDNDGDLDLAFANSNVSEYDFIARNDGGGSFSTFTVAGTTGVSRGVAWGDYDNDGDLDLAIAADSPNSVLATNNGDGTFSAPRLNVTDYSQSVGWGDFNNDGYLDLAFARSGGNDTIIRRNSGDGAFVGVSLAGTGGDSLGAAWGDYDNDGDLDLALANDNGEDEFILRNDGGDAFIKVVLDGSGGDSPGVSWGDYDGDGDPDLAASNFNAQDELILRNDAAGTNASPVAPSSFSASFAEYGVFSDSGVLTLRWDGATDAETSTAALNYFVRVGTTTSGSSTTFKIPDRYGLDGFSSGGSFLYSTRVSATQRGIKLFAQKEMTFHWGVVTEDGAFNRSSESVEQTSDLSAPAAVTDLAVAAIVSTGLGAGEMTVTLTWTAPGDNGLTGTITDGVFDIRYSTIAAILTEADYVNAPFLSTFTATVSPGTRQTRDVTGLDASATHYFALTVKDTFGARSGLSNPATGQSYILALEGTGGDSYGIAWGDYDGDGDLDLAVANGGSEDEYIATNNGDGTFSTFTLTDSGGDSRGLAWGDFDNDGDLDLAVANAGSEDEYVARNDGGGTFSTFTLTGSAGDSQGVAWGDYDNDGDLDLAVANASGQAEYIATNNGDGTFSTSTLAGSGGNSYGIAWGDYDNDGDLDLAIANDGNDYISENNGDGTFETSVLSDSGGTSRGVAWGDYDEDGDLDLAFANASGEDEFVLRNDGGGTFTKVDLTGTGGASRGVAWADFDNDGDLDLAVANHGGEDEYVAVNNGNGTFSAFTLAGSTGNSTGISWGDYDGDGDLDLAVASDGDVRLLRNDIQVAHNAPAAPASGFSASFEAYETFTSSGVLTLRWDAATDVETSTATLNYLVRVGTSAAGSGILPVPERYGLDGYSGGGSFLYSTRLSPSQPGIEIEMQKETTVHWAVTAEDGESGRGPESVEQRADLAAPAAVGDLVSARDATVQTSSVSWVRLTWTSPGADGAAGALRPGAVYDVRWTTAGVIDTEAEYVAAPQQEAIAAAGPAGAAVSKLIPMVPGKPYYFALTTKDSFGVRSALSNGTTGVAPSYLVEETTDAAKTSALQDEVAAFLRLRLWSENGSLTWKKLKVRKVGTLPDAAVSRVAVYKDANGNGIFDAATEKIATRSQAAVFVSSAVTLTINVGETITGTTATYFVGLEFEQAFLPVPGSSVSLRLDGEAFTLMGGGISSVDFPGMSFDGTDDRVTAPYSSSLDLTEVTLETWVNTTDTGSDLSVITRGTSGTGYRLWLNGSGCGAGVPTFYVGSDYLCADRDGTPVAVHDGRWHHVAASYSVQQGKAIFFDGVPLSTGSVLGTISDSTGTFALGGPNNYLGAYLNGAIDDVRVSALVRYSTTTAFTPSRRRSFEGGERVLYHFDAGAGAGGIADDSGFGNHGTLEGWPVGYGQSTFTAVNDNQDLLYSTGTDITPDIMFRNQQNVPLLKLQLRTDADFVTLEQLSVAPIGSGAETGVTDIRMSLDDGDGDFDPETDSALLTIPNFVVGEAIFNLAGDGKEQLIGTSTRTYFFSWKVGDAAELDADLGIEIPATSDFVLSGSTDIVSAASFPIRSATRTVVAAETAVVAETAPGAWVNTPSIVFVGNFGSANVDHFRLVWDRSPGTLVGGADTLWSSGTLKSTVTATSDADDWYFHVRAFDQPGQFGTQQDIGPYWVDRTLPSGGAFLSRSSTGGALSETQFNDLASAVTAQMTVADAMAGLNLDGPAPLASSSGTVSLWDFDEASGAAWEDSGPAGLALAPGAGTPQRAAGRFGAGLLFHGAEDLRNASPTGLPTGGARRSIEAWIRPVSTSGAMGLVSWGADGGHPTRLLVDDGRLAADLGSGPVAAGPALSTGVWQHVAFTFEGGAGSFYVDGVSVGTHSFAGHSGGLGTLFVGATDLGEFFKGTIDELRVLDRALPAGEVLSDYERGHPYYASYSTDAGSTWRVVAATAPATGGYVTMTGAHGTTASQTLTVLGLDLVTSTGTATGALATNQVRFHAADAAANVFTAGPFGILVDTNSPVAVSTPSLPAAGTYAGTAPDFTWTGPSTGVVRGMGGEFLLQVSQEDPAFDPGNMVISVSTPAVVSDAGLARVTAVYLSTFTLTEGATYYWRVRSQSRFGILGPWSPAASFVTDASSPTGGAFRVYSSSGGVFPEGTYIDLLTGVTAQITVSDGVAGLGHEAGPEAGPGTVALWHFDETDGSGARDAGGNGNTATLSCTGVGCEPAGYAATPFGAGVRCKAGQGVTALGGQFDFAAGSDFTLEAWIKPDLVSGDHVIAAVGAISASQNVNYVFRVSGSGLFMTNASLGGLLGNAGTISIGTWQHVAAVASGTKASFYVDGRLTDSGSWGGNSGGASMPFSLCAGISAAGVWDGLFSGVIDEVRVLDYAADADEIGAHYAAAAPGRFAVEYSTTAGTAWNVVSTTVPVPGYPYLNLSGAPGSVGPETLAVRDLRLAHSTTPATGGLATNQLRFVAGDRRGNVGTFGPYAVIVDTVAAAAISTPTIPGSGVFVSAPRPNFAWTGPSTSAVTAIGSAPVYILEVDDAPDFLSPEISISTPAVIATTEAAHALGAYVSTFTLAHDTTYYWRVRSPGFLGFLSPALTVSSFVTDFTPPASLGFATLNSTGGAIVENLGVDLLSGVTVQITVQDTGPAGLAIAPVSGVGAFGVVYNTVGGGVLSEWIDGTWAETLAHASEDAITSLARYQGRLYAGTDPSALVLVYDGGSWGQSADLPDAGVLALEEFQGKLYAGLSAGTDIHFFDGGGWYSMTVSTVSMKVNDLKGYNGRLYAATDSGGRVWAFDPDSGRWHVSFDSSDSEMYSFEVYEGRLFAGGSLSRYVFDGSTWTLSEPISAPTFDMQVYNGRLYAGTGAGGVIKVFDGTGWNSSYDPPEDETRALGVHDGRLYAGIWGSSVRAYMYDGNSWMVARNFASDDRPYAFEAYAGRLYTAAHIAPSSATVLVSTPIAVSLTGTDGTTAPQTLEARGLDLATSISGAICGGTIPCGATNQVRLTYSDRAGSIRTAGPFAILVDPLLSVPAAYYPADGGFAREERPTFSWVEASTQPNHTVQVAESPAFSILKVNDAAAGGAVSLLSSASLDHGTTYYWRVRAHRELPAIDSGYSDPASFVMDLEAPTTAGFTHVSSTGGVFRQDVFNDLSGGVTVQLRVQDPVSGLGLDAATSLNRLGIWHLEGSTDTVRDFSEEGNAGVVRGLAGNILGQAGYVGNGARFSGTPGNSIDVSTLSLAGAPGLTVALWAKPLNLNLGSSTIWASEQVRVQYDSADGKVAFRASTAAAAGAGCPLTTAQEFNAGAWSHVAFVMAPGLNENRLYVNGALAASCSGAGTPADSRFRFGEDGLSGIGGADPLNGMLDELRVFGAALSAAELAVERAAAQSFALYSTDEGNRWTVVSSTVPSPSAGPRLAFTGASGSTGIETVRIEGLELIESSSTATCGGVGACLATNQVRFFVPDRAGNLLEAGPFSILVDTSVPLPVLNSLTPLTTESLYVEATAVDNLSRPIKDFLFEASTSTDFSASASASGFIAPGTGINIPSKSSYTFTGLLEATTYFVRVTARDYLLNVSTPSVSLSTSTFGSVFFTTASVAGAGIPQNTSGAMLRFTLANKAGTSRFDTLRVKLSTHSTASGGDITKAHVYADTNGNDTFEPQQDTSLAGAAFVSGVADIDLAGNSQIITVTTSTYFVAYQMAPEATVGDTVGLKIADAFDVGLQHPFKAEGPFPIWVDPVPITDGPNDLSLDYADLAPETAAPGRNNVALLRLDAITDTGTSLIDAIVVHLTGTLASNEIAAVNIWRDDNADAAFNAGDDVQLTGGSDFFTAGVATLTLTADPARRTVGTVEERFFLTVNIGNNAALDDAFQVRIATPSDVRVGNLVDAVIFSTAPIIASTVTVRQPNIVEVRYEDLVPAAFVQGGSYAVLKATMTVDVGSARIDRFLIGQPGTGQDSDVEEIGIWRDAAVDGLPLNMAVDVLVGSATFASREAAIDIATQTIAAGTTGVFFITYQISPSANPGNTLALSMTNEDSIRAVDALTTVSSAPFPIITSESPVQATTNYMLITKAQPVGPGSVKQGAQGVPVLRLDVLSDQNNFNWTGLVVESMGTASESIVENIRIFRSDDDQLFDIAKDVQVTPGVHAFSGGSSVVSLTPPQTVQAGTQTFFVVLDISPSAVPGESIGARIPTTASFNLIAPNRVHGDSAVLFPLVSNVPSIVQFDNEVTVSSRSITPGAGKEPGAQNIGMMELSLNTNISSASWQSLNIHRAGNATDGDVAAVRVYYDVTDIGDWDPANLAQYALINASTMTHTFGETQAGEVDLALNAPPITPTPKRFFVVVDLSTTAVPGRSFSLRTVDVSDYKVDAPNFVSTATASALWASDALSITPPPVQVSVAWTSVAPSTVTQGDTNVVMLRVEAWTPAYSAAFSQLTVRRTGGLQDAEVPVARLFRDDGNGALSILNDENLGAAAFSAGLAEIKFATQTITSSPQTFFVTYNIKNTARSGQLVGAEITAATDFKVDNPNTVDTSAFPMQSEYSTVQPTNTQMSAVVTNQAPGQLKQAATNQVLLNLSLYTADHALTWTQLTLRSSGTASDADIQRINVYHDNGRVPGEWDDLDSKLTSGLNTLLGGVAVLGLNQEITPNATDFLVTVDIAPFAEPERTFSLILQSTASLGVTSPNTVLDAGFPYQSDPNSRISKLAEGMTVTASDLIPEGINQGTEAAVAKLEARSSRNKVRWESLSLTQLGSLAAGGVSAVRLYRDSDASGHLSADDLAVGSGMFAGNTAAVFLSSAQTVGLSTQTYFLAVELDLFAPAGDTLKLTFDAGDIVVSTPDYVSSVGLPFINGSVATVLDAKTPTKPVVTVDGPFSSNFEYLHFVWSSTVTLGDITGAFYAVGTTPGGQDVVPFTAIAAGQRDVEASGFPLLQGTTYYVAVKAQSTIGADTFDSPVGISIGVLMDLVVPEKPAPSVTPGGNTLLITWAVVPGGPSGIMGYLIEYRRGDSPVWYNAKTLEESRLQALVSASARPAALSQSDLVSGGSYQATGLPRGTLFVRIRSVSNSGVLGDPSDPIKVQLGSLPAETISAASSYPNPFDSRTGQANIHYVLKDAGDVSIKIFSLFGRLAREMSYSAGANGGLAGSNTVSWDGTDDSGRKVSKGVYLAILRSGGAKVILKIGVKH